MWVVLPLFSNVIVSSFWTRRTSRFVVGHRPPHVSQAFPIRFCILQAIKNWRRGWPENEANSWPHRQMVLYSGKLLREKTFVNFTVLFSLQNWGCGTFGAAKVSNPRKFSPWKSYFSPIRRKFSPSKVSRYTVASPGAAVLFHLITLNLADVSESCHHL